MALLNGSYGDSIGAWKGIPAAGGRRSSEWAEAAVIGGSGRGTRGGRVWYERLGLGYERMTLWQGQGDEAALENGLLLEEANS